MKNLAGLNKWVATTAAMLMFAATGASATAISGTALKDNLVSMGVDGSNLDMVNDQIISDGTWSIVGTGLSANKLLVSMNVNSYGTFGIYDFFNASNKLEIFSASATPGTVSPPASRKYLELSAPSTFCIFGTTSCSTFTANKFGYYLTSLDSQETLYSDRLLNAGGLDKMVTYSGGDNKGSIGGLAFASGNYVLAWDNGASTAPGYNDFNDYIVLIESARPVSEPATLSLLGLGLLAFGLRNRKKLRA